MCGPRIDAAGRDNNINTTFVWGHGAPKHISNSDEELGGGERRGGGCYSHLLLVRAFDLASIHFRRDEPLKR